MAPVVPKKRSSIRAKASRAGSGLMARPTNYTPPEHFGEAIGDSFSETKKDKRTIKHSAFVNRITKANTKPLKRRRPGKKLVATMESLADALGDIEDIVAEGQGEAKLEDGKVRHKSLKSRPGAMKRKEKLEKMERERFGKNMAQLTALQAQAQQGAAVGPVDQQMKDGDAKTAAPTATSSRWAALRGFIGQTMEQKSEFIKKW